MSKIHFQNSPFRWILGVYLLLNILFTFLYLLPASTTQPLSFIDAWFLSTSGISVTGLSTIDVSERLSSFGQVLLMIQIQIGGIGIMAILGTMLILFRKEISLPQQTLMGFDQNQKSLKTVKNLMVFIVLFSLTVQFIGFLIFYPYISELTDQTSQSVLISLFHSFSSFTGAGFDLFGNSLLDFSTHTVFVLTTAGLIFFGVIGFPTIIELIFSRGKKSLFTKINLIVHGSLLVLGFIIFLVFEFSNKFLDYSSKDKLLNALFLSVTSRNAGLTTIDIGTMLPSSLLFLMVLMFIGASASSCGGGIRMTTFGVLVAKLLSVLRGREEVVIFKKALHEEDVNKSFLIFFSFIFLFCFSAISLTFVEAKPLQDMAFEVMSALTTTGLSTGITADLTTFSKVWLSALMIVGRIGIVALIYSLLKPKKTHIKYVKEHIIVG